MIRLLVVCTVVTTLLLGSCGNGTGAALSPTPVRTPLPNGLSPLVTPTYDGSGQGMHPSVLRFKVAWNGYEYWMAMTPYPNYDATKENPSILVSSDGTTWSVPPGLVNPIHLGSSYLADPELYYDSASDQLWLFYLWKTPTAGQMVRQRSSDGIRWTAPEVLFSEVPNGLLSPTVDRIGDKLFAWYVDASPNGYNNLTSTVRYRTSTDGTTWSSAQNASIEQKGYVIWHIEARQLSAGSIGMLASSYPSGKTSGETTLFYAYSADGVTWTTYGKPSLSPSQKGWDNGQIYRSTFLYDPSSDLFRVWYSARSSGGEWHTGYTEMKLAELVAAVQR